MRIAVCVYRRLGLAVGLTDSLAARNDVQTFVLDQPTERPVEQRAGALHLTSFAPRQPVPRAFYWNDWLSWLDLRDVQRLEKKLASRIDSEGFDVVLASPYRSGRAPGVLQYLRTPSAYYCYEPLRQFREPWCRPDASLRTAYEQARFLYRWPAQTVLDAVVCRRDLRHVRRASTLLTHSAYSRAAIGEVYAREAEVCYPGVDLELFSPPAADSPRANVISGGILAPHRGFDFLIQAIARVPQRVRPSLTIATALPPQASADAQGTQARAAQKLRRQGDELGVNVDIRFIASEIEVANLYRSHSLFVFGAHFEPLGHILLQAMACGLPVVAVSEGGVPEVVRTGETGLLVDRDEAAFAGAVECLLLDRAWRVELGRAARQGAAAWTWEASATRVESILQGLAQRSPADTSARSGLNAVYTMRTERQQV